MKERFAPTYANLYMGHWEGNFIYGACNTFKHLLRTYVCNIDNLTFYSQ